MTIRAANKGEPLSNHLTADFLNKLKRPAQAPILPSVPVGERYDTVLGQIAPTNTAFERINTYYPAIVEDVFIPQNPDHFRHLASKTVKVHGISDWSKYRPWGIALDPINQFKSGRILMVGVSWLDITTLTEDTTEHTHIDVRDDKLVLQNSGPCRIISYKKPHALVCMNQSPPGKIVCLTTSTIAPATFSSGELTPTFGTVKIYDWNTARTKLVDTTKTISVGNMSLGTVNSGAFVHAFFYGSQWLLDYENCAV